MKSPSSFVRGIIALFGVVVLSSGSSVARSQPDSDGAIRASLQVEVDEPTRTWSFVRAEYEVDIYGASAIGTMTHQFHNDGEEEFTAVYEASWDSQFVFKTIELETEGAIIDLEAESYSAIQEKSGRSGRRTAANGPPLGFRLRSNSFTIGPGEDAAVRVQFGRSLSLSGRNFLLELPRILVRPSASRTVTATESDLPLKITVTVQHDQPLEIAQSDSHEILVDFERDRTIVETVHSEVPAGRNFKLEFATNQRGAPTFAGFLRESDGDRQAVEAILNPPEDPEEGPSRPKQVLFIVDTSGSMKNEEKLDQARRAVFSCIEKLGDEDRFNIVEFDTRFSFLIPEPAAPTVFQKTNVSRWLDGLSAGGGTTLLPALEAVMEQPDDPDRHRMIILVSDGILNDEKPVLELLDRKLGDGRLFVVGTGTRIRQQTILTLAEHGRGAAAFAGDAGSLEAAVQELFASVASPLGWDLEFDWGGADVEEITPARLPDLYGGRSVKVLAWVRGDLPDELRLKMSTMDGQRRLRVKFPPRQR